MLKFKEVFLVLTIFTSAVFGQDRGSSVGWDLTYESLLKRNNVAASELIWVWLKKSKSPAEAWLAELKGKPVTSVILIEFPAFHAAERTTILLFRAEGETYYWEYVEGGKHGRTEEPVKPSHFDAIFKEVMSWQQLPPKRADELPDQVLPGYMGFLSYFDSTGSRQMLLTVDDFFTCPKKSCNPGEFKSGRLMAALEPILIPEEKKSYKHKTEAEIAGMTTEERIHEQIKEHDHLSNFADRHDLVIQKYLRRDGPKTFPYLVKLMDDYKPRRLHDSSAFVATLIAVGIDENVVRLRASEEGRQVIEAMKRLEVRKRAEYKETEVPGLKQVTGTNFKDQAIADALWLSYRINMSESELLEFANYLIKVAPDYPSWSETEWKMDLKRSKESRFSHTQGAVVKKPLPYYQRYLEFKRVKLTKTN